MTQDDFPSAIDHVTHTDPSPATPGYMTDPVPHRVVRFLPSPDKLASPDDVKRGGANSGPLLHSVVLSSLTGCDRATRCYQ